MTDIDEKMQLLRAEYCRVVMEDIRALQQKAEALCGDEQDRPALEHMVESLHRMAGGAGVFGLQQLSQQSHTLELALTEKLALPLAGSYSKSLRGIRSVIAKLQPGESNQEPA